MRVDVRVHIVQEGCVCVCAYMCIHCTGGVCACAGVCACTYYKEMTLCVCVCVHVHVYIVQETCACACTCIQYRRGGGEQEGHCNRTRATT